MVRASFRSKAVRILLDNVVYNYLRILLSIVSFQMAKGVLQEAAEA